MQQPGDLTRAVWLYEGNFPEWLDRMDGTMGFLEDAKVSALLQRKGQWAKSKTKINESDALIRSSISPQYLARLPNHAQFGTVPLVKLLKQRAQPFRFLDLSSEIRKCIYDLIMKEDDEYYISEDGKIESACPSILHVSRQVRSETLATFYSTSCFSLDTWAISMNNVMFKTIRNWVRDVVKDQVEYLRHVQNQLSHLHILGRPMPKIDIRFSRKEGLGLGLGLPNGMNLASRSMLEDYVAAIEAGRDVLGLEGEGLNMVLVNRPELWKGGIVRCV